MSNYVAAGAFFVRKMTPIFWEALHILLRCRGCFIFQKSGPHIFGRPTRLTTLPQALFSLEKWALDFLSQKGILAYARKGKY